MKRLFIPLLALLVAVPVSAQTWSLDNCIDYALEHNPTILHSQVQYDIQNSVVSEATGARVPIIKIGAQETFHAGNLQMMYGIDGNAVMGLTQMAASFEMPLLTGGAIPNRNSAEKSSLKVAEENIAVSRLNVKIKVAAAYMQLLNDLNMERIALEQMQLCKKQLDYVTQLVEGGRRTQADLSEAKSSLSTSEFAYTEAKGNTAISKLALINLLGLDSQSPFEVEELSDNVEGVKNLALMDIIADIDRHPAVMSAKYNLESAGYREKAVRGGIYPQISLFANYNNYFFLPIGTSDYPKVSEQLAKYGWGAVGLKLSIPIIDIVSKRKVKTAKLGISNAQITLDESRKNVTMQMSESYCQTVVSKDRYFSAQNAEDAAHKAYESQKALYDAGRSTSFDLEQSRLKWFKAGQTTIRSKYEYILRSKILEYYNIATEE